MSTETDVERIARLLADPDQEPGVGEQDPGEQEQPTTKMVGAYPGYQVEYSLLPGAYVYTAQNGWWTQLSEYHVYQLIRSEIWVPMASGVKVRPDAIVAIRHDPPRPPLDEYAV